MELHLDKDTTYFISGTNSDTTFKEQTSDIHLYTIKVQIKSVNRNSSTRLRIVDVLWWSRPGVQSDTRRDLKVIFLLTHKRVVIREVIEAFVRLHREYHRITASNNTDTSFTRCYYDI